MRNLRFVAMWILGLALVATAQQVRAILTMEKVMTSEELRATGITTLTPSQRLALDKWLNNYTERVLRLTHDSSSASGSHSPRTSAYAGVGSGHWVTEKSDNGAFITLEDGSLWEVNPLDRVDTSLWLPITNITVVESRSPLGEYRYLLINTDDDEKALAKYLGKG